MVPRPPNSPTSFAADDRAASSVSSWLATVMQGNITMLIPDMYRQNPDRTTDIAQLIYMAMNKSGTGFPDLMDNSMNSLFLNLRPTSYHPVPVRGKALNSASHAAVIWP
ncbi:hypothetical protein GQ44DRAFT_721804 [Phaeosphaeriaceae sp. PMI808]|nr:hypothetical protein GQ44DRAFT_721804 [Phaeosphaeriaceae sp. PMI808]